MFKMFKMLYYFSLAFNPPLQCQSPYIKCRNRPKDVCDRGLCKRCCVDFGRKNGTDCYGHMLFFTEGNFSDAETVSALARVKGVFLKMN